MTPERQKWWDSLPAEEKYIRKLIKHLEDDKKRRKAYIGFNPFGNLWRLCVKDDKMTIKLLRKQIAMDVIALHNSAYEYYTCPYCGQNVREGTGMRDEDRYCASCGQKLRWE